MDLNDRKRKILQAIIDEYIGTAEPVGSRSISKRKTWGCPVRQSVMKWQTLKKWVI